jgi:hypothetical protein
VCEVLTVRQHHIRGFLAADTKIMELKDERVKKITEILHVRHCVFNAGSQLKAFAVRAWSRG